MALSLIDRIKLAQYHNARGVRMLKCRSGVDSCGHRKAFLELAGTCFEARDHHMSEARIMACKRKVFLYQVESLEIEGRMHGDYVGHDELAAGSAFEDRCYELGIDHGIYRCVKVGRVRL